MNATDELTDVQQPPGHYEIRLQGRLDARWAAWFDGMSLSHERNGVTLIHGPVIDQAALHGLLQKVRDVGLPLISVVYREPGEPDVPAGDPR
jgi:hypothetical protein